MKRIIFLVFRLIYRIPGWLLKIRYYNKHLDTQVLKKDLILLKS